METFCSDNRKDDGNSNRCICLSGKFTRIDEINENSFLSSKLDIDVTFKNICFKLNQITQQQPNDLLNIKITILPDFFVDRIIKISNMNYLADAVEKKIKVGGGSIRGLNSVDIKGGNAVNVAYCLARLGVKVDLFTVADEVGYSILDTVFKKFSSQVRLHVKNGKHGLTTIFEFTDSSFSVSNVMLSDVGDNSNFGPESIESANDGDDDSVLSVLSSSSAVVLTNWASNLKGTDLLKYVFKNSANSLHFLDPADITERREEFIRDIKNHSQLIDLLSINENELLQIMCALTNTGDTIPISLDKGNTGSITPLNLCKYAMFLSNIFKINLCIHTMIGSVWSDGCKIVFVNSIPPSKINIVSGAGDSWDSAFLFGHLLDFTDEERLCFANLFAFLYLENVYNDAPSLLDIVNYIRNYYIRV
ncbi:MAG: carbohydrate kinase family protein [Thermoproteota archaeon]|nr:carbohydrate kinase family protein [Thermoproteota archaeon]